jgi:hypothetical protein
MYLQFFLLKFNVDISILMNINVKKLKQLSGRTNTKIGQHCYLWGYTN